jgi:hypothetical protein
MHKVGSKLQDQDAGIVSGSVGEGIGEKRLGYFLAGLAVLGQFYRLLVLTHVPQAIAGHHQVQCPLVNLELLVVGDVAHSLRGNLLT